MVQVDFAIFVIVCYSKRNVPYIAMFSELSTVTLVTVNGIQFQGGEYGGIVKVIELTQSHGLARMNRSGRNIIK